MKSKKIHRGITESHDSPVPQQQNTPASEFKIVQCEIVTPRRGSLCAIVTVLDHRDKTLFVGVCVHICERKDGSLKKWAMPAGERVVDGYGEPELGRNGKPRFRQKPFASDQEKERFFRGVVTAFEAECGGLA